MVDQTERPDASARPGTPWWVKVIGIAILMVLLLAAAILLIGGGRHGPALHGPSGAESQVLSPATEAGGGWREIAVG